jgi:alkylhydroperoxidase/carboxymuconolactone decarboxylase family protein YurZ
MTRQEIYAEVTRYFGFVPKFLDGMHDDRALELEWEMIKRFDLEEGPIDRKHRALIELTVCSALGSEACIYYTREAAKANGASDEEIEYARHIAKHAAGWAAYANSFDFGLEEFKQEVDRGFAHYRESMKPEERRRAA